MPHVYTHRDAVKDACGIAASSTGDHDQIDASIEAASRLIDDWLGYPFGPQIETRLLRATKSALLRLDKPLTAVTTLRTDAGGDGSYESTWSTAMYWLNPANATGESPPAPYWEIEQRVSATSVFPVGISRGVELAGTWGYYDRRENSSAVLSTTGGALDSTQSNLTVTFASALHAGQTIRVDEEQMFIQEVTASAAGAGGQMTVLRAQNGTTGATHATGAAIQTYRYPIVERAALYEAQRDFRAGLGLPAAGSPEFVDSRQPQSADLSPTVRRMLAGFRRVNVG